MTSVIPVNITGHSSRLVETCNIALLTDSYQVPKNPINLLNKGPIKMSFGSLFCIKT